MDKHNLKPVKLRHNDLRHHMFYLVMPLVIFVGLFLVVLGPTNIPWTLLGVAIACYLLCWGLDYVVCQRKLNDMCKHLEKVVQVNQTTYELMGLSSNYENEPEFLEALLRRSVDLVPGAEMGCIIILDEETQTLKFQTAIGMDLDLLQSLQLPLANSFSYRLTEGKCDRVVTINDMRGLNAETSFTQAQQDALMNAAHKPILSTLSSPIYVNGKLYAMMNLDSSQLDAYGSYDQSLASILTHEASNAISLYHKSRQIAELASRDSLTGLYNRTRFQELLMTWSKDHALECQLVVIDMNNLKSLNDEHGHQAGDKALIKLADTLKQYWGEQALLARFGGDEFVVLRHGSPLSVTMELSEIRASLDSQPGYPVRFSAGLAPFVNNWSKAFKQADRAMYSQKRMLKAQEIA
ncbi:sensor domain-containing diguanylate cyclase [Shewanella corallii]|uniref:diguanylate cyclase n=1 Tax=Shewanella corallii TaxID=560080 RepID=A0ABT0N377_9GAMM|nr:sensor domain-containing diguanylate cyclase [Shewanella corallii]MCL2912878.1 sensor domain-containing diguanylate cyclase [Shewanella corallii]